MIKLNDDDYDDDDDDTAEVTGFWRECLKQSDIATGFSNFIFIVS